MKNVVPLFDHKNVKSVLVEPERTLTDVREFLAASADLGHAVTELSKRFDAIDETIASIDDAEARSRLKRSTISNRETLARALSRLTQEIVKLIECSQK